MKHIYTLFIFTFIINITHAQAPAIAWQKAMGGSSLDVATDVKQTTDNGYIVCGYTYSNDDDVTGFKGDQDFWVVKTDATGTIQWNKTLGGSGLDRAHSIEQTIDGGYIVAGYTYSNDIQVTGNHGGSDFWIVKLSDTGGISWRKALGGSANDIAQSIQQTNEGGYIVAGSSRSTDGDISAHIGGNDFWVVKIDSAGAIQWEKSLGGSNSDEAYSIQQTTDNGYIVAGYTGSNNGDVTGNQGNYDFWVTKLDNLGALSWQKTLGGSDYEEAKSIQQTSDGGYIVAGYTLSNDFYVSGNNGSQDFWVTKLSDTGNLLWQKTLGGSGTDSAECVQETTDGGFIVTGSTTSNDGDVVGLHNLEDYWAVKLNNLGTKEWQKPLGGAFTDIAYSVQQTNDGGFIIAGTATQDSFGGDVTGGYMASGDFWLAKLEAETLSTLSFESQNMNIYPNPVSDVLHIDALQTIDKISIFNILGQKVLEQKNANLNSILDVSQLDNGLYLFKAYSNNQTQTFKVIKR